MGAKMVSTSVSLACSIWLDCAVYSPHRQPAAEAVVEGAAGGDFYGEPQRHFERVGAVVVIGDGELLQLLNQQLVPGLSDLNRMRWDDK